MSDTPNPAAAETFDPAFWEARAREKYGKANLKDLKRSIAHCRRTLRRALPAVTQARILIIYNVALEVLAARTARET